MFSILRKLVFIIYYLFILFTYLFIYYLFIYLFIYLLFIYLFIIYLFIYYLFIYLFILLFLNFFIYLFIIIYIIIIADTIPKCTFRSIVFKMDYRLPFLAAIALAACFLSQSRAGPNECA